MMLEMSLAFIVLVLIISAMSIGVILAKKPIKGSCGGIAALGMDASCDICGRDPEKCDEDGTPRAMPSSDMAYDASSKR